jgi:uncharacterized protein (TIGR00303 family)
MTTLTETLISYLQSPPPRLTPPHDKQAEPQHSGLTPVHGAESTSALLARHRGHTPLFVCVAAHTDTSGIPRISSAGATEALIPFTAAADLEALKLGQPRCLDTVPSNPLGPPGPALITRAGLALAGADWIAFRLGLRVQPVIPSISISSFPGGRIDRVDGVPDAASLFQTGLAYGAQLATMTPHLVIGETVPGGTTTAMAVLRALDLPCRVSASSAGDSYRLKASLVDKALQRANTRPDLPVMEIVKRVGDPMQPFVAGLIVGAAPRCLVTLAGGTQMAAVLAMVHRLEMEMESAIDRDRVLLATTPWVARDPHADLAAIIKAGGNWNGAIPELDFNSMAHRPLRHYEDFLVKEGVGAGGMCLAAISSVAASLGEVHAEIDQQYLSLEAAHAHA